ncbi:MAG: N-acetylneuraminate synthase family protein [Chitinophagales bacterium]|nr:N-acetylneuraminate synthase family protein [Bacteroidota bacterium]
MFQFNYQAPKVIAEIGCNHMGNFEIAKELIRLAKECGADYAKFQKRNPKELLSDTQYNAPHPEPWQSYGNTYGQHREYLEFTAEQHGELKLYAESIGIGYSASVWDITSANEIIALQPDFIKIPSACNHNIQLLELIRDNYLGDVHISVGMTTSSEIKTIIDLFNSEKLKNRLVLYSCTSGYPIQFNEICLLEIKKLHDQYGEQVQSVGFSGHHLGIAIDIAAYTLGATWIERHFTKDRTWKGTDHAASLEVPGLQKLIRDLQHTHEALQYKASEILPVELVQRKKLKSDN